MAETRRADPGPETRLIRPPGALRPEQAFRVACERCDACRNACPHGVILCDDCAAMCPGSVRAIRMQDHRPVLDPDRCVGCGACAVICPAEPNAITILTPKTQTQNPERKT